MAQIERKPKDKEKENGLDERIIKRLDMLESRLDNVDSIVTAVAERIMRQPMTVTTTCPHCGQRIEIALMGNQKPAR